MVTEPSALTVQPVQPGGHAHVGVTGEHISVAVAETVSGEPSHVEEAAEIEHVIAGGVWSTTMSVCVHMAIAPVESVAWKVSEAPLLPYAVDIEVVPSVLVTQPSALAGHEPYMVSEEPQPPEATAATVVVPVESHSTVAAATVGQVMTTGTSVIWSVSLHVAALPELSLAEHTMICPLLPKSALTVTLPSALTVQPMALAGHAHLAAHVPSQTSEAEAETLIGAEPHGTSLAEMEQVIAGGVVSTTAMVHVLIAVSPVAGEVAV
jgi:hypothetical protein